jgi:hypothetical protein
MKPNGSASTTAVAPKDAPSLETQFASIEERLAALERAVAAKQEEHTKALNKKAVNYAERIAKLEAANADPYADRGESTSSPSTIDLTGEPSEDDADADGVSIASSGEK